MERMHQSATDMIQETTTNYAIIKCKGFYRLIQSILRRYSSAPGALVLATLWFQHWSHASFVVSGSAACEMVVINGRIEKRGTEDCVMIDD